MPSFAHPDTIFLGLDVHRDSISVALLHPGDRVPLTEKISADEDSVRRLVKRFEAHGYYGPATRPGPPVTTCAGCCARWESPAR